MQAIVEQIDQAVAAHAIWKMRLERSITSGELDLDPDEMADEELCRFGQWLSGSSLREADRAHPRFGQILAIHGEFHRCAAEVLELADSGQSDAARDLMNGSFLDCSDRLLAALSDWKAALVA